MSTGTVGVMPPVDEIPNDLKAAIQCGTHITSPYPFACGELFNLNDNDDSVNLQYNPGVTTSTKVILFESQAEYNEHRSFAVDGSMSGLSWNADAKVGYSDSSHTDISKTDYRALTFTVVTAYMVQRNRIRLATAFAQDLANLKATPTTDADWQEYRRFLDTYGTHYLYRGVFGGTLTMETAMTRRLVAQLTEHKLTADIKVSYDGMMNKGSITANAAYQSSQLLKNNMEETDITVKIHGGHVTGDPHDPQLEHWIPECSKFPILLVAPDVLLPELKPISDLVPDTEKEKEKKQQALVKAIAEYYTTPADDSLFGHPTPVPVMTECTALHEGFLYAFLDLGQDGRGYADVQIGGQSRGLASVQRDGTGRRWGMKSSLFLPVSTGSKYYLKTWSAPDYPEVPVTAHWSTLQEGVLGPSTIQAVGLRSAPSVVPDKGGFLLCQVAARSGGDRCNVWLVRADGDAVAATSQHYYEPSNTRYPTESFCVPVPPGGMHTLYKEVTAGNPLVEAFWYPLKDTLLGERVTKDECVMYQAETDGFVVALLWDTRDGDVGQVDIHIGDKNVHTREELLRTAAVTGTSMHMDVASTDHADTWLKSNTLTVPVKKSQKYLAQVTRPYSTAVRVYFVPLTKK